MAKMTHWRTADAIDASAEKAAVYQAQGWALEGARRTSDAKVTAMTTASVDEGSVADAPPAKPTKAAAKKPTKRAAKKS